ncbi:MAG: HAD family hydrolase [Gemmatimonadaceae bacterium]|nr:HAD family hydrolase [Gemmatimonadaceae bacterium]
MHDNISEARETRHFLIASDFDQTLSFNDSGLVLSELLGMKGFEERVEGLAESNLVQQGGELAYLIRHDPEFRSVRREHLVEAGRRVRLKSGIPQLVNFLTRGYEDARFSFFVVSAAPRLVVESALAGIVPPENIFGTELDFDSHTGEVRAVRRVPAGYGKVAVIESLRRHLRIATDRVIYVGDGSSDVHVMLHVNNGDGFTIAVSENQQLARIAKRTVLSDSAFSILLPVLNRCVALAPSELRDLFEANGFRVSDWERERTDRLTVSAVEVREGCNRGEGGEGGARGAAGATGATGAKGATRTEQSLQIQIVA